MNMFVSENWLSDDRVQWHLDVLELLINNFAPNYGPLRAGFCDVKNGLCSDVTYKDAAANPNLWATDYLNHVKNKAGLQAMPVRFMPLAGAAKMRETAIEPTAETDKPYIDNLGQPIICFYTNRIYESGYLSARAARSLAELLLKTAPRPEDFSTINRNALLLAICGFLGLGIAALKPAARRQPESEADTYEDYACSVTNAALSSALFLMIKGYDAERLVKIYAGRLDAPHMTALGRAFDQLSDHTNRVQALRSLAIDAKADSEPEAMRYG